MRPGMPLSFGERIVLDMVTNKWYVVDRFSGPVSGPFDTRCEAENERVQLNIADDCVVLRYTGRKIVPVASLVVEGK